MRCPGVEIDDQNTCAGQSKVSTDVHCCRGLSDSTFLVGNGHHTTRPILRVVMDPEGDARVPGGSLCVNARLLVKLDIRSSLSHVVCFT